MRVFKIEPSELICLRADLQVFDVRRGGCQCTADLLVVSLGLRGINRQTMPSLWNLSVSGTVGIPAGVKGRIFGLVLSSAALVLILGPGVAMLCLCKEAPPGIYTIGVKVFIKGIQCFVQEPGNVVSDPWKTHCWTVVSWHWLNARCPPSCSPSQLDRRETIRWKQLVGWDKTIY